MLIIFFSFATTILCSESCEIHTKGNVKYFKNLEPISKSGDLLLKNKIIYAKVPITIKKNK